MQSKKEARSEYTLSAAIFIHSSNILFRCSAVSLAAATGLAASIRMALGVKGVFPRAVALPRVGVNIIIVGGFAFGVVLTAGDNRFFFISLLFLAIFARCCFFSRSSSFSGVLGGLRASSLTPFFPTTPFAWCTFLNGVRTEGETYSRFFFKPLPAVGSGVKGCSLFNMFHRTVEAFPNPAFFLLVRGEIQTAAICF